MMLNTLTEHLELLTTTHTPRSASGRGSGNKLELTGIKKLRELILELAVRGKLVPQNPEDEPASVLLERIAAEKGELIAEGKIKRQKPLPAISDDEKPFELPTGWEWVRLGSISADIHYGYTASASSALTDIRLLRITDIQNDKVNWEAVPGCDISEDKVSVYELSDNDILIARTGGTIGKSYLVRNLSVRSVFASYLIRVRHLSPIYADFVKTYLGSQLYWLQLYANSMGTGQPNVNGNALKGLLFALPPEQEQHLIVAKVDELMALCDQLEQEETDSIAAHQTLVDAMLTTLTDSKDACELAENWSLVAEHFDTLFTTEVSIARLRQTILQLAVMGRLVPQNPDDEPAARLLERIAAEKAQLIKAGKIKPQKSLPAITKKPFTIPANWVWLNMADCFALVTDGDHQAPPKADSGVPFLVIGNLNTGKVSFSGCKYVPENYYQSLDWGRQPINGDLLYTVTGSYGIPIKVDTDEQFCVQRHVAILKVTKSTPVDYFKLLLASKYAYDYATMIATGIAQKTVPLTGLRKLPVPIPPEVEIVRIVTRVNDLMTLCDTLQKQVQQAQSTQQQLASALVEQAIFTHNQPNESSKVAAL